TVFEAATSLTVAGSRPERAHASSIPRRRAATLARMRSAVGASDRIRSHRPTRAPSHRRGSRAGGYAAPCGLRPRARAPGRGPGPRAGRSDVERGGTGSAKDGGRAPLEPPVSAPGRPPAWNRGSALQEVRDVQVLLGIERHRLRCRLEDLLLLFHEKGGHRRP